jgi:type I restriction enzyme S subunit
MKSKLTELCDTISDTYRSNAKYVVLINTSDVLDGKVLNHQQTENRNLRGQFKKTFQQDDILYSEIRPKNKRFAYIDFTPTDYIASTKLMVLRAKTAIVTPQFLYQMLKSYSVINELQGLAETRSGTFPQITYSELANIEIDLPDLAAQRGIAATLSALDDKIAVNTKLNHNLEQTAQAIFKSWLDSCTEFTTVGEVVDNILDYTPNANASVVLVNSADVHTGHFAHHALSANENLKGHFKKRFSKGDILYSEIRPLNRHFAFVGFDADDYIASTRLMVLRNKQDKMYQSLIYQHLKSDDVVDKFATLTDTRSGTFPQGCFADLANIPVAISSLDEQKDIAAFLDSVLHEIAHNDEQSDKLATIRDELLPRLMSGELTVNG